VLVYVGLLVAVVSSLGSPLIRRSPPITVSFAAPQWSLTITLLIGAVSAPLVGRLGAAPTAPRPGRVALELTIGSVLAALPIWSFLCC